MILIVLMSFCVFADEKVLIEMHRSKQGITESFVISTNANSEYLIKTSNRYTPKRLEFGIYQRKKSFAVMRTLKGIASSQKKKRSVASKPSYSSPHEWKIKVLGKDIDRSNSRYFEVFRFMEREVSKKNWKPLDVRKIKRGPLIVKELHLIKNQKSVRKHKYFDVCHSDYDGKPICEFKTGFVFLD